MQKQTIDLQEYSDQAKETLSRILALAETIRQRATLIQPNQSTATSRGAVIDTRLSQIQIDDLKNLRLGIKLAIEIIKAEEGITLKSTERKGLLRVVEYIDKLDLEPHSFTATRTVKKLNPVTRKETGRKTVESINASIEDLLTNFEKKLQFILDEVNSHID